MTSFDLSTFVENGMHQRYIDYKRDIKEKEAWCKQYEASVRLLSDGADELFFGEKRFAQVVRGQFAPKRFADENPAIAEQFTEYVTEKKLNAAKLREAHPELFERYCAERFVPDRSL